MCSSSVRSSGRCRLHLEVLCYGETTGSTPAAAALDSAPAQAARRTVAFRHRPTQGRGVTRLNRAQGLACPARTPRRGGAGLRWSPGGASANRWLGLDGLRAGQSGLRPGCGSDRLKRFGLSWAAACKAAADRAEETRGRRWTSEIWAANICGPKKERKKEIPFHFQKTVS
jgi:hypothetical protein